MAPLLAWTGIDTGSGDHPMNTTIRYKRPDALKQYEKEIGKDVNEVFPEEDLFVMHKVPFRAGITHVENVGGNIEDVLNTRCMIGAFPIPIEGGEASPSRVVAFIDE
jgi:arylformamidase